MRLVYCGAGGNCADRSVARVVEGAEKKPFVQGKVAETFDSVTLNPTPCNVPESLALTLQF